MSTYPSVIASFSNPGATDRLNSPSHSGIETAQNTNLTAIENFVGVEGASSVVGTLIYDIRSPASNGGGHVQAANVGGTGQVSYTKGDILIAQSSSVLTKLAAGLDGQFLSVNSSVATGVQWSEGGKPKLYTSTSVINAATAETSFLSMTLPASTLGTTNAVRTTALVSWANSANGSSIITGIQYGGNRLGSVAAIQAFGAGLNGIGILRHTVIASTATIQQHFLDFEAKYLTQTTAADEVQVVTPGSIIGAVFTLLRTKPTSSVNSSTDQTLGLTTQMIGGGTITLNGIVVEKVT